jgi:hypothetical protein
MGKWRQNVTPAPSEIQTFPLSRFWQPNFLTSRVSSHVVALESGQTDVFLHIPPIFSFFPIMFFLKLCALSLRSFWYIHVGGFYPETAEKQGFESQRGCGINGASF